MPIIRVTKKQIEEANKAREAALQKDEELRHYEEEQRQRLLRATAGKGEEQPS
jgi:acyl-CoA reductase-like NAD-dependent aldehyde dehydrogenase